MGLVALMGRRAALAVATFLAGVLLVVVGTVGSYDRTAAGDRNGTGALSDYRDALYQPLRAMAEGVNPYDHEAYLAAMEVDQELPPYFPVNYLPFAPLTLLPLPIAAGTFVAASVVALVATGLVAAATARPAGTARSRGAAPSDPAGARRPPPGEACVGPFARRELVVALAIAGAAMLTRPGFQALQYGQSAPWIGLGLATAVLGLRRDRPWLVAVGVAAAWAKPSLGLPVAALLLLAGQTRAVVRGTAIATATWIPIGLVLWRVDGPLEQVRVLIEDLRFSADHPFGKLLSPSRVDAVATVAKLAGRAVPGWFEVLVAVAVLAVTGWAVRRLDDAVERGLLIVLGSLIALWRQPYDLVLLLGPLAALALSAGADGPRAGAPGDGAGGHGVGGAAAAVRGAWATAQGDRRWWVLAAMVPAAASWAFGQRAATELALGPIGAARLSAITGVSLLAAWAIGVDRARARRG